MDQKQCHNGTAFLFSYFYAMRLCFLALLLSCCAPAWGQIRLTKLVLQPKQVYELTGSDILVVDTLIMHDSSRIVFSRLKPDIFIHAKKAIFYSGVRFEGKGIHGLPGRKGRTGTSPSSPCSDGGVGMKGTEGTSGGAGINLSLFLADISVKGTLLIDVSGGDGGDGGAGGPGGGGGPGTRLCPGGNGGAGAAGANGGNGGAAGTVTFTSIAIPELRFMLGEKIYISNYGGNHGLGGDGGMGGYPGLSPVGNSKMDGKTGRKGVKGKEGLPGKDGAINFKEK
jgi:hypothetical protein